MASTLVMAKNVKFTAKEIKVIVGGKVTYQRGDITASIWPAEKDRSNIFRAF